MKSSIIYATAGTMQEAKRIASTLLKEKLAACINIFPIQSFYRWDGKLCNEKEAALIIKTAQNRVDAVMKRIKSIHSYKIPCIISFDIEKGNKEFLDWIAGEISR